MEMAVTAYWMETTAAYKKTECKSTRPALSQKNRRQFLKTYVIQTMVIAPHQETKEIAYR